MRLLGTVTLGDESYYLRLDSLKATEIFYLISAYTAEDSERVLSGLKAEKPVLHNLEAVKSGMTEEYVIEAVKRYKVSGKVECHNDISIITRILDTLAFAEHYTFSRDSITLNETTIVNCVEESQFAATDGTLSYRYEKIGGDFTSVYVRYRNVLLSLSAISGQMPNVVKNLQWKEIQSYAKKQIQAASLKTVTYEMLCEKLDMTWYKKDGVLRKNYRTIKTIDEFEDLVIRPIAYAARKATETGVPLLLAMDTETTGLNICNLAKDNPSKDHCVAIPLSWEDDQGVVIFTDMKHFNNVPNSYAWKRLAPFVEKGGKQTITLRKVKRKESAGDLRTVNAFDDIIRLDEKSPEDDYEIQPAETIEFDRALIDLIGHNTMFDGKVGMDNDVYPEWDDDTMQMGFVLNPTMIKGNNKLKMLTRKLFGHETPELTDVLGKGNEDKYQYLSEEEVAKIYGCADGDYTRQTFKKLRHLMLNNGMDAYRFRNGEKPVSLLEQYRKQDVPMLNILYRSEYNGMRLIEDKVKELAQQSEENLECLKSFMYQYVGRFIDYNKKADMLRVKYESGLMSYEEYAEELRSIKIDPDAKYIFDIKGSTIRTVIYEILKYPIKGMTTGKNPLPSVDKKVMKKLISYKKDSDTTGGYIMQHDLLMAGVTQEYVAELRASGKGKLADSLVLISAKEFNKKKYPLALVLQKYAELNKEYTSYFKPILTQNLEGKLFKSYSLARIETRRIMNPGQTMKANLKAMVRSYSDDYYVCDWDMSQVEYRIMTSLSGHAPLILKMSNPENDYHIETAAMINRIAPHEVSRKQRKNAKNVSFGKPYGLSIRSLAEVIFGDMSDESLTKTRILISAWEQANGPIVDMLEQSRDEALVPVECTDEFRTFIDMWEHERDADGKKLDTYKLDANGKRIPVPFGIVTNRLGFYRIFDLSNMSDAKRASIRRAAGNYPIQSYAAELFRRILIRFYLRCEKEGIADKVVWHMLIHDELLCSVHKSVHPFRLFKILKEECMVSMKGHTKYFIGINIGNTWAECKDDSREAPVYFVNRMVKRYENGEFREDWVDNPGSYVMEYRKEYIRDRIGEVVKSLQPDFATAIIDFASIEKAFTNYTVRAYIGDYYKQNYPVAKPENEDSDSQMHAYNAKVWESKFESWALEFLGEGHQIKRSDGSIWELKNRTSELIAEQIVLEDDLPDIEDVVAEAEDTWDFDTEDLQEAYTSASYVWEDEDDFVDAADDIDLAKADTTFDGAKGISAMLKVAHRYKNLLVADNRLLVTINSTKQLQACKKWLQNKVYATGYAITFKTPIGNQVWLKVDSALNLDELDARLEEWK